jgi:hypothetical protein
MQLSFIVARTAARIGVAVWRHRFAWVGATVAVAAFGAYQLTFAGPGSANGDCADTAMAALTQANDNVSRAAYACLGPGMRSASEDQFVLGMRTSDAPHGGTVNRVTDQHTADGGRIVFYTVQGQGSAIGYLVYLDAHGKVIRVD